MNYLTNLSRRMLMTIPRCTQPSGKREEALSVSRICTRCPLFYTQRRQHSNIKTKYQSLLAAETLNFDPKQQAAVEKLHQLEEELIDYDPPTDNNVNTGILQRWFGGNTKTKSVSNRINGVYMYGSVGAGKTMLMDLFYESVQVAKKQRVHFNAFMLEVHKRIHHFKKQLPSQSSLKDKPHAYDPIGPVARGIASEAHLLCFDEFQVIDIADAMILKRLFAVLFDSGVVVVATSNRRPDDLYKNGLQRSNFIPFIHVLKRHCDVIHLDSTIDYRRDVIRASVGHTYMTPNTDEANGKLLSIFQDFAQEEGITPGARELEFLGRKLPVPSAAGKLALFSFKDLCSKPLSAADYLEICSNFDMLFIRDIPKLTIQTRTEARRFITMIDTVYDHRIKLVCSAEVEPEELFSVKPQSAMDNHEAMILTDDLDIEQGTQDYSASIFTGEEEIFAFKRTISRLIEMQGEDYWKLTRKPPTHRHQ